VILFHVGDLGQTASFGTSFVNGGCCLSVAGVLLDAQMVQFAYSGVELIGIHRRRGGESRCRPAASHEWDHVPDPDLYIGRS